MLVVGQALINEVLVRAEDGSGSWLGEGVGHRLSRLDSLVDRMAGAMEFPCYLANALMVDEVCAPYALSDFH